MVLDVVIINKAVTMEEKNGSIHQKIEEKIHLTVVVDLETLTACPEI